MTYSVVELDDYNAPQWEKLNEESSDGTLFHSLKWKKLLEQSLGFVARYFLIYREGELMALCPMYQRAALHFSSLVALPVQTLNPYNHIIVTDRQCSTVAEILQKCREFARSFNMSFVDLGLTDDLRSCVEGLKLSVRPTWGHMVLDLRHNDPDKIWNVNFSNNQRNKIRRFEKDGFTVDSISSLDELKLFYDYYEVNLRGKGAEVHPLSFFEELLVAYPPPENMILTVLRRRMQVAGGLLGLLFRPRKTMYWRYFALNRTLPSVYSPTYCLLWDAIKRTYEMGYSTVNLGITPPDTDDVNYRLKEKFGCRYERRCNVTLPISMPFKFAFAGFRFAEKHGLTRNLLRRYVGRVKRDLG